MYQKVLSLMKSKCDALNKSIEAEGTDQIKRDCMAFMVTYETFIECLEILNTTTETKAPAIETPAPVIAAQAPVAQELPRSAPAAEVPVTAKVTAAPKAAIEKPLPAKVGGKYRRLKNSVNKPSYKQRDLNATELDAFNTYWNDTQKLIDRDDPVCAKLVEQYATPNEKPIYAYQVAGWFSFLSRLARMSEVDREAWIDTQMSKYGKYTVRPVFTKALVDECNEYYLKAQEDARIRAAAHAELRAKRLVVSSEPVEDIVPVND